MNYKNAIEYAKQGKLVTRKCFLSERCFIVRKKNTFVWIAKRDNGYYTTKVIESDWRGNDWMIYEDKKYLELNP